MSHETVFTVETSRIKFGPGATKEVGYDMKALGASKVMVVTDPGLSESEPVWATMAALASEEIEAVLYDQVRIEPTDTSFRHAIDFAQDGGFDGFIGVGGGSSMDTAKVANLYSAYPADFLEYVNVPIGQGRPVPGALKPLIAVPTTAGTGSETTGVAIFDLEAMHAKTGIADRALRPALGIVDPDNTCSLPRMVTACSGLDVLCHALESLTAMPYQERSAPENPGLRPAYQGANPTSHVWASEAIEIGGRYITRAMDDPADTEARFQMMLAATYAGIGFGNAGVTLPHGMSYPVAGMVRDYIPPDYPQHRPMIPHGMAVILHAPAAFRFMAPASPDLHLYAAELLGADVTGASPEEAGDVLAGAIIDLMRRTDMPNGLGAVGYGPEDVDRLVEGTLPQHRVTKLSPRPAGPEDLREMFLESLTLW